MELWLLIVVALAVGVLGYSDKPVWRNRGSRFGSFGWWKKSRAKGWWW